MAANTSLSAELPTLGQAHYYASPRVVYTTQKSYPPSGILFQKLVIRRTEDYTAKIVRCKTGLGSFCGAL